MGKKRACVVVLGDWGRSPRMQYHALSLARNRFEVDVVAYEGTEPHEALRNNILISHHYLQKVPSFEKYLPRLLTYVFKTLWQGFFLFAKLLWMPKPDILLLQNPPSIPTLPCCWLVCWLRNVKFMIDFHNYGYTLLALSVGKDSRLVKICKWCETYFGRKATYGFCVSDAMQKDLANNWDIRTSVFYDCPPEMFHPISMEEKHAFLFKLGKKYSAFQTRIETEDDGNERTRFTIRKGDDIVSLDNRPALIVSSTSWTEDEDFSILLHALAEYDQAAELNFNLPNLIVAITGKGPLKSMYEELIEEENLNHVEIITLWLAAEDYPKILGCADVGVSLHCSTSGLDLPMKVVDMFGCCLPVCAFYYPCVEELVKRNENGCHFLNGNQLSSHLQSLFKDFPRSANDLLAYRKNLMDSPLPRWSKSWNEHVFPIIRLTTEK